MGPVYVFGFSVDKRQSVPIFAFFLAMLERRASAVLRAAALFRRICLGFALSKHSRAFRTAAFLFLISLWLFISTAALPLQGLGMVLRALAQPPLYYPAPLPLVLCRRFASVGALWGWFFGCTFLVLRVLARGNRLCIVFFGKPRVSLGPRPSARGGAVVVCGARAWPVRTIRVLSGRGRQVFLLLAGACSAPSGLSPVRG